MLNFDNFFILDNLIPLFLILIVNFFILSKRKILALKLKLNDYPDERKIHNVPTPLIGGICLFITLIPINYFFYLLGEIKLTNFLIIVLFYTSFFLIGLWDDIQTLSPKLKTFLIIFTLTMLLLINDYYLIYDLQFKYSDKQIDLNIFSFIFTIFCFFSLYNALNFIDGYNGVSISISIYWITILLIKNPNLVYLTIIFILIVIFSIIAKNVLWINPIIIIVFICLMTNHTLGK